MKRVSNLIQEINYYNVVNKYDLTWQTLHAKIYKSNDKGIIITLKNQSATKKLDQTTYDFLNI